MLSNFVRFSLPPRNPRLGLTIKACFWFWTKVRLACERPIEIDYQMVDEAEVTPLPDSEDEYVCVYESEGELVEKVVTYCWTHQNKRDL